MAPKDEECNCCDIERRSREAWQFAHVHVHEMEAQARELAFVRLNERLAEMNEVRRQINEERGAFLSRDRYEAAHEALRGALDQRLKLLETGQANAEGRMWMLGAGISGILVIVQIALHFIAR